MNKRSAEQRDDGIDEREKCIEERGGLEDETTEEGESGQRYYESPSALVKPSHPLVTAVELNRRA